MTWKPLGALQIFMIWNRFICCPWAGIGIPVFPDEMMEAARTSDRRVCFFKASMELSSAAVEPPGMSMLLVRFDRYR